MTIKEALQNTKKRFAQKGIPSPESDAQWLLEVVMGLNRLGLMLEYEKELSHAQLEQLEDYVARRETREPLQWILGFTEFYGLSFKTRAGILIPRPETERLVELVLERVSKTPAKVVDIGTGTGAIALALKAERPNLEITATDINSLALELTQQNANNLNLEIRTVQTSILDGLETVFDVIVSNPPYLPTSDAKTLELEVQLEPQEALFSGKDGLDLAREIVVSANQKLKAGGLLALELDPRNAFILAAELEESGWQSVLLESDLAERERFVLARRRLSK